MINPYLTPELVIEGWFNDFKRTVAVMRKELGLKPGELTKCIYTDWNPTYEDAVEAANKHNKLIKKLWQKKKSKEK